MTHLTMLTFSALRLVSLSTNTQRVFIIIIIIIIVVVIVVIVIIIIFFNFFLAPASTKPAG